VRFIDSNRRVSGFEKAWCLEWGVTYRTGMCAAWYAGLIPCTWARSQPLMSAVSSELPRPTRREIVMSMGIMIGILLAGGRTEEREMTRFCFPPAPRKNGWSHQGFPSSMTSM
jgi:hypothetical protein